MRDFPWAAALLLDKRKPKARNVLIGSDRTVIKALERKFTLQITEFNVEEPKVFSFVDQESQVPLAEQASVQFWRNPPIARNKELLTYIVSTLLPDLKETVRYSVINGFLYDTSAIRDFDVLYWRIRNADTSKTSWNKQPWESAQDWVGQSDPDSRLAKLYHDLRSYLYVLVDNKTELKTLNVSAQKIKYLETLKLSNKQIVDTLGVLAQWRFQALNGTQATFLISNIWSQI